MLAESRCAICAAPISPELPPSFRKDGFDIVTCPACGLLARRTLPEPDEVREIYEEAYFRRPEGEQDAQGYFDYVADEQIHRLAARKRLDRLAGRYTMPGRALDVGCASGFFLDEVRSRGWTVQGVDVAPAMTALARERFSLDVQTTDFAGADLEGRFDLVTMWDYIEHTTDPVADVRHASELLAAGGLLALSTGDAGSLSAKLMGSHWHLLTPRHHNFFFRRKDLHRVLGESGLRPSRPPLGGAGRRSPTSPKVGAVAPSSRIVVMPREPWNGGGRPTSSSR